MNIYIYKMLNKRAMESRPPLAVLERSAEFCAVILFTFLKNICAAFVKIYIASRCFNFSASEETVS
jgi:hypothetical protein